MSYVLDGVQYNTLSELSAHWLGHTGIEIKELIGTGKIAEDLRRSRRSPTPRATPPRTPTSPSGCG